MFSEAAKEQERERIAGLLLDELDRHGISKKQNSYYGLSVEVSETPLWLSPPWLAAKIYNSYEGYFYDAIGVLRALRRAKAGDFTLDEASDKNIWDFLDKFAFSADS